MATVEQRLTGNRSLTVSLLAERLLDSEIGSSWLVTRLAECFILQTVDTLPTIRLTSGSTPGKGREAARNG